MFTVEIRINGSLVSHIYGLNTTHLHGFDPDHGDCYECQVYDVEKRASRDVSVRHHREDGINALVAKIIKEAGQ